MTLFELADPEDQLFKQALDSLCGGVRDEATVQRVREG